MDLRPFVKTSVFAGVDVTEAVIRTHWQPEADDDTWPQLWNELGRAEKEVGGVWRGVHSPRAHSPSRNLSLEYEYKCNYIHAICW